MIHPDDDALHHSDTVRLEAVSDGVFAIAITLLIIEIGVPHVEPGESLADALRLLWPSYFGYALSFATIGIMWINHHGMFKDIERADHSLLVLNLLLLLCISFIPFPTAVFADYIRDEDGARPAALAYAATFTATAVAFNAMWLYASRNRRLIDHHVTDKRVRSRTLRYLPGPAAYALGIPFALIAPWLTIAWFGLLAIFFLLPIHD